jgi:hypothetical protein
MKDFATIFLWGLILGALGFAAGFFGPILLRPEANQGPLLGIFITGPLGVVLGLAFGAWRVRRRELDRASVPRPQ